MKRAAREVDSNNQTTQQTNIEQKGLSALTVRLDINKKT